MKYKIVKVQTSVEPPGQVLIYNEDRSIVPRTYSKRNKKINVM